MVLMGLLYGVGKQSLLPEDGVECNCRSSNYLEVGELHNISKDSLGYLQDDLLARLFWSKSIRPLLNSSMLAMVESGR